MSIGGASEMSTILNGVNSTGAGGAFTARGFNTSFPMQTNASNMAGTLSYMGKTTLFSRVAISPNAVGDKKAMSLQAANKGKPNNASNYDQETSAST